MNNRQQSYQALENIIEAYSQSTGDKGRAVFQLEFLYDLLVGLVFVTITRALLLTTLSVGDYIAILILQWQIYLG